MKKIGITSIHIEEDMANKTPTLVYKDEKGHEWVQERSRTTGGKLVDNMIRLRDSVNWYK